MSSILPSKTARSSPAGFAVTVLFALSSVHGISDTDAAGQNAGALTARNGWVVVGIDVDPAPPETFRLFVRSLCVALRNHPFTRFCVQVHQQLGCSEMIHCIHCLEYTLRWVPSDVAQSAVAPACYGCSSSLCALRMDGATKNRVNCGNGGCKKLSNEDVELLTKLEPHQRCNWRSNRAYKNDSIVHELRCEIGSAIARLTAATEDQRVEASPTPAATPTSTDGKKETKDLAIENLRVQIDIRNSLRGLFEVQHRSQAYREAAAGNSSALAHIDADNFPHIPPRVGLSTLPRNISLAHLVDSEDDEELNNNSETANAAGKKRAAPNGDGLVEEGGKRPRTE